MKNKAGTILMIIGIVLLIAAVLLFTYNRKEDRRAKMEAEKMLSSFDSEMLANTGMDEIEINGKTYMGELIVPDLGLELPVLSQWSYENLLNAPCRYAGSLRNSDLVIMAHNYSSHFGRLYTLSQGSDVYFKGVSGETTAFELASIEILNPDQVEEMCSEDYPLTLFTCTYGGRTRVTLRCRYRND